MKLPLLASLALAAATAALAAPDNPPAAFNLWPGSAPGETGDVPPESSKATTLGMLLPSQTINVTIPNLTVFRPAHDTDTGVSVIVCPGGGFHELEMEKEGEMGARWLNSIGVTGFVLKYRVPERKGPPHLAALQDIQRAIRLVRSHAAEWGLKPDKIGVMGFSAGACLDVLAATRYDEQTYPPVDAADAVSCRPDFGAIIYAGGLLDKSTGAFAPGLRFTKTTPQLFIVDAEYDRVDSDNSTLLFLAMKRAGAPAELHMYTVGVHGFAFRPGPNPHSTWPDRCRDWMVSQGILAK